METDSDSSEPAEGAPAAARTGPWGFWATIGLSLAIAVAYVLAQTVLVIAVVIAAVIRVDDLDVERFAMELTANGFFWSVAVLVAAPVTIGLTVLFAALAKGITVREYLALERPDWKSLGQWGLILLVFIICVDVVTYQIHGRLVPPFLEQVYRTAWFPPLLWFAFVVVAPITEEVFFRGFLFKGIEQSSFGPPGAILISSIAWAFMHTQYDIYGITVIFIGGLVLGYARLRSRSLYVPVAMHMIQNAVATFEVAFSLAISVEAVC